MVMVLVVTVEFLCMSLWGGIRFAELVGFVSKSVHYCICFPAISRQVIAPVAVFFTLIIIFTLIAAIVFFWFVPAVASMHVLN